MPVTASPLGHRKAKLHVYMTGKSGPSAAIFALDFSSLGILFSALGNIAKAAQNQAIFANFT